MKVKCFKFLNSFRSSQYLKRKIRNFQQIKGLPVPSHTLVSSHTSWLSFPLQYSQTPMLSLLSHSSSFSSFPVLKHASHFLFSAALHDLDVCTLENYGILSYSFITIAKEMLDFWFKPSVFLLV